MSKNKVLLAVKGQAQHGKDTVVNILVEEFGFSRVAFADPVKRCAEALDPYVEVDRDLYLKQSGMAGHNLPPRFVRLSQLLKDVFGWDNAKQHPDVRRLLQRMGTEVGREVLGPLLGLGDRIWLTIADNSIDEREKAMISDLRFPNEGEHLQNRKGFIVDVFRPNFDNGVDTSHPSESQVKLIPHDFQIVNDGDENTFKNRLREQVVAMLQYMEACK